MQDYGKAQSLLRHQGKAWNTAYPKRIRRLSDRIPAVWHKDRPRAWDDAMGLLGFEYMGTYDSRYGHTSDIADFHIWLLSNQCANDTLGVTIQIIGLEQFTVEMDVDSPEDMPDGHYEKLPGFFNTPVEAAKHGLLLMRERLMNALAQLPDPKVL